MDTWCLWKVPWHYRMFCHVLHCFASADSKSLILLQGCLEFRGIFIVHRICRIACLLFPLTSSTCIIFVYTMSNQLNVSFDGKFFTHPWNSSCHRIFAVLSHSEYIHAGKCPSKKTSSVTWWTSKIGVTWSFFSLDERRQRKYKTQTTHHRGSLRGGCRLNYVPLKFNNSSVKSYWAPIRMACLPTTIFQGRAVVKLRGCKPLRMGDEELHVCICLILSWGSKRMSRIYSQSLASFELFWYGANWWVRVCHIISVFCVKKSPLKA